MRRLEYPLRVYVDNLYKLRYFTRKFRKTLVFKPKSKEKIIDKDEIYERIRKKVEYYIDLQTPEEADLITCFIIGTYCYEIFSAFPYLFFNGLKNSGKTKSKMFIQLLSFNAVDVSNISEASFFRTIEGSKGTLCVDEYENMSDEKRKLLNQLLNSGYQKGQYAIRTERVSNNKFKNIKYSLYSPKIICNIEGLNAVTQSRTITIRMLKTKKIQGKREPNVKHSFWQEVRNDLYLLIMQNWQEINQKRIQIENTTSELNARDNEKWKPIITISKFISETKYLEIVKYAGIKVKETDNDLTGDWNYLLLKCMYENSKQDSEDYYKVKTIKEWTDKEIHTDVDLSRWIGKTLKKMPIFKSRNNPDSEYRFNKILVKDMMERLNYPVESSNITNISNGTNVEKDVNVKVGKPTKKDKKS